MSKSFGTWFGFDVFVARDRGSLRLRASREDGTTALRVELPLRVRPDAHLGVKVDPCEGEVLVTAGLGATLYVGVESRGVRRLAAWLCPDHKAHAVEAYVTPDDGGLDGLHAHWNVWTPVHEWDSRTPKWRNGGVFLWSAVFGDTTCATVTGDVVSVEIPMPEGVYRGTATVETRTWTRPRWPFGAWHTGRSITVDCPGGVPHPGKGENSWDCDEDATFASSTRARTVGEAVGQFVGHVLERRQRYGGAGWRPAPKSPANAAS